MPDPEFNVRDRSLIEFLLSRRSVLADAMSGPGPSDGELRQIVEAGMRVPDHGRLTPWRFVIIRGEARERLGAVMEAAFRRDNPDAPEQRVAREGQRFVRAPVVVAVVSQVTTGHKIPEWEQILSSGAACQTMLIAALCMGYAAQWLTEWYAYDPQVGKALGLEGSDRIAGFLYIGNAEATNERARPSYDDVASEWQEPVAR